MLQAIAKKWWVLLLRGLGAIALGLLVIWMPGLTLLTLVILWGLFALVDGIAGITLGIRGEADGTMWWTMMLLGVIGVGAAITAFIWPGMTAVILLWIIAWTAICDDMEQYFRAGRFQEGAVAGVRAVGKLMAAHYPQPPGGHDRDELPNRPALL